MPKSISRKAKVEAAIKEIRRFHELGSKSLGTPTKRNVAQMQRIDKEATRLGINPDKLRKARQFADAEKGYSERELALLCQQIRKNQMNQKITAPVFGQSHVYPLLTVNSKEDRLALQKEALKGSWSVGTLKLRIKERYGTRKDGGRRQRSAKDENDYLCQLEKMCESWRRRHQQSEDVRLQTPKKLREQINNISQLLLDLQTAIDARLKKQQGERQQRSALKNDNDTVDRSAKR